MKLILLVLMSMLVGCGSNTSTELDPPLEETGRQTLPPDGCQDLRQRGGTC